jgi:hypothetical protein
VLAVRPFILLSVTKAGHGFVSEGNSTFGSVCPIGAFNAMGNKRQCIPCPGNLTTAAVALFEVASCGK